MERTAMRLAPKQLQRLAGWKAHNARAFAD